MTQTRAAKKMHLLLREQRYDFPDRRKLYGVCVWCGYPGGDGFQPYILRVKNTPNWGSMDMHEWLFKRNRNLPKSITFSLENVVLLHTTCHAKYGQSKEMVKRCYEHKKKFYNLQKWVDEVVSQTNINPIKLEEIYGGNMQQTTESPLFVDVQTVFDERYANLADDYTPMKPIDLEQVLGWSIPDIKQAIENNIWGFYSSNYHTKMQEMEEKGKNRNGVFEALRIAHNKYLAMQAKLATTPQLIKIVALGMSIFKNGKPVPYVAINKKESPNDNALLKAFWDKAAKYSPLVAYSFNGFTFPVIKAKTAQLRIDTRHKLGIKPFIVDTAPWKNQVLDIQYELKLKDWKPLDWVYEAYIGKKLKSNKSGADIPDLYHNGQYDEIEKYSRSRLQACSELYLAGAGIYWPDHLDIAQKQIELQQEITNNLPSGF